MDDSVPEDVRMVMPVASPAGRMSKLPATVYALLANHVWAKLYRTVPPREALELILHQINFAGATRYSGTSTPVPVAGTSREGSLAADIGHTLRSDFLAGRFDALVVIATPEFISAINSSVQSLGIQRLLLESTPSPRQFSEQQLMARVSRMCR